MTGRTVACGWPAKLWSAAGCADTLEERESVETFDVRVEVTRGQWAEVRNTRDEAVGVVRARITRVENDG